MTPTVGLPGAAELMHVHPKTVQDLIKSGALPAGKIGKAYVLLTKDVLAHVEKNIIEQTAKRMKKPARLPKAGGKVAAPKVGVSHHHAV